MDKATLDILLSLAKPLAMFRKELVDNGVPEWEDRFNEIRASRGFTDP